MSAVFGSYDGQLENTSSMSDVSDVYFVHTGSDDDFSISKTTHKGGKVSFH